VFELRLNNNGYGPNPNNPDGWGGDALGLGEDRAEGEHPLQGGGAVDVADGGAAAP
jgi:hypothetical protein